MCQLPIKTFYYAAVHVGGYSRIMLCISSVRPSVRFMPARLLLSQEPIQYNTIFFYWSRRQTVAKVAYTMTRRPMIV